MLQTASRRPCAAPERDASRAARIAQLHLETQRAKRALRQRESPARRRLRARLTLLIATLIGIAMCGVSHV